MTVSFFVLVFFLLFLSAAHGARAPVAESVLQLMLLIVSTQGKLYLVPDGWSIQNNNDLPEFQGDGRSGSYRLLRTPSHELLVSHNKNFALAFLNFNGTGNHYLALMFGTRNSTTAAPVWLANREVPVSESSKLTRATDGRLTLLNTDGSAAWSSETSVAYIGIEDTGNLLLYNKSQISVWQSFDHPGNNLVVNQKVVTGQSVVSNKNSSDPAKGQFSAEVEPSGGILNMNINQNEKQTYALWSFLGSKLSSPAENCPGYQTSVRFTEAGGLSMEYEPVTAVSSQACGSPLYGKVFPGNTSMRYFQLAEDGTIVSYRREGANETWQLDSSSQYFPPPAPCGSYGLFEKGTECKCLSNKTNNSTISVPGLKCSKPKWLSLENCNTRYETDFVTIAGASYFSNSYNPPNRTSAGVEDCLEECKMDCTCAALFFDQALQNCFYVKDVSGSLTVDPSKTQQLLGFLKYQNYSKLVPVDDLSSKTVHYITIGVTSGAAGVAILIFALLFAVLHRRRVMLRELNRFLSGVEASPYRFSYSSLYSATKGFSSQLGSGGFGTVYEGNLHNGMKLAVKTLKMEHAQKQFIAEVAALGSISHVNIVKLYGFCADASRRLLVYEFMPKGSLDKWIFDTSKKTALGWNIRYNIALDTARGLTYLHEESRDPIMHLDIKPQNILLDDSFHAKVGDFGMAKLLMDREVSGVVTGVRGTPGYLAPEWLMNSTATKKCDVYSFGLVLLELIGGRRNLDCTKLESPLSWYFPVWAMNEVHRGDAMAVVDSGIRDSADRAQAKRMIYTALWCIQEDPGARPTMHSVVRMLESSEEIPEPPITFRFDVQAPGILSIVSSEEPSFSYCLEEP